MKQYVDLSNFKRDKFKDVMDCIDVFKCGLELSEEEYLYEESKVEFSDDKFKIKFKVGKTDNYDYIEIYFIQNDINNSYICEAAVSIKHPDFRSKKVSAMLKDKMHRRWRKSYVAKEHYYEFFPIGAVELQAVLEIFFIKKQFT